jgi:hypothetical protein
MYTEAEQMLKRFDPMDLDHDIKVWCIIYPYRPINKKKNHSAYFFSC